MNNKRANGEGSITFDKARGAPARRSHHRRPRRTQPTGADEAARQARWEVVERMKRAQQAIDAGLDVPNERLTVGQWLTRWLDTLPGTVSEGTEDTYRRAARLYVRPAVGARSS